MFYAQSAITVISVGGGGGGCVCGGVSLCISVDMCNAGVQTGAVAFRGVCTFAASSTVYQEEEKKRRKKKKKKKKEKK